MLAAQQSERASVYALGPEVAATTKYGKYFLRFFSEFGGENTPQGHMIVLGGALLFWFWEGSSEEFPTPHSRYIQCNSGCAPAGQFKAPSGGMGNASRQ